MTLMRWQRPDYEWLPFRQLSNLRQEIDRLFDSPLSELAQSSQQFLGGWVPTLDLFEDKDHVYVRVEVPGMKREEIDISLHEGALTISGERKLDDQFANAEIHRSERFLGRFQRTVSLPVEVKPDACKAQYKDGILTVTLAKAEQAKPKQIEIK